jgi:hypothetical protein
MYRPARQSELKALAKTRAVREAKQPYAAEIEDRETETIQNEKRPEPADGGRPRRRRRPDS